MFSRSAGPTEGLTSAARRRLGSSERATHTDGAASDQASPLRRSALAFALRCHAGQQRGSDGAPFIEHPNPVMRDRARFDEATPRSRVWRHLEYVHQLRLEHFQQSLRMLQRVAPGHPLVRRLALELDTCPITIGHGTIVGQAAMGPCEESGRR